MRLSSALVLILLSSVIVPTSAGAVPDNPSIIIKQGIDPNISNLSSIREEDVPVFTVTPTPIDLFRAELDQETLPGPRYMAFGPSTLGFSIDPRVLAVCFAVAFIVVVIWFVSFRNRDNEKEE